MFTDIETLLAADRFHIRKTSEGVRILLTDDFMPAELELLTVEECLDLVRRSLNKGHKVFIEVSNGSSNLPSAASA